MARERLYAQGTKESEMLMGASLGEAGARAGSQP